MRRALLLSGLLFAAAGAADAAAPPIDPASLLGSPIASLEFHGDAPVDAAVLTRLTDLGPGKTLSESAVRSSLRNLFATRRFTDLSIRVAPSPEGARVVIGFAAAPRVASVSLEGKALPVRGRLRDALGVGAGDSWAPDRPNEVARRLRRVLRERGVFEAEVDVQVLPGPDESSVDVRVNVKPGRPARAAAPEWDGDTAPLGSASLAAGAKQKPGKVYREAVAREDAERYAALFRRAGHARAEIRFEGERYDASAGTATPRYAVYAGPRVVLKVTGLKESEVKGRSDSPWEKGEPPDEEAVRRLAASVKQSLQEKGYAKASVDVSFQTAPGEERITMAVTRGSRYTVSRVSFEGRSAVAESRLRAAVGIRPRGLLETGRLVEKDLALDREALAAIYRAQGYPDARVARTEVKDGKGPFTLEVVFHVEEGSRVVVSERTLTGAAVVPRSDLESLLAVKPGAPFIAADVDADVSRLRSYYLDRGFVDSRVEAVTHPASPDGSAVAVTYKVFEGEPVLFGKTIVRGNRTTRDRVVEREIAHREGEPYSLARLSETQQNLARLGVFQRVEFQGLETDSDRRSRTLLLNLTEAKPWSVLYGLGAEYDRSSSPEFSPRFSLGVTYANLFGRAMSVAGEARYSRRDTRLLASLRERSLFDWGIPASLTFFRAQEVRSNFEIKRRGTFLQGDLPISQAVKLTARYQYEIVEPNAPPDVLSTLERQYQQISISSIAPGVAVDTRDDPVDPRRGVFVAAEVKWAFPLLDANARFLKAFGLVSLFRPFGSTRFALSLRVGAIESFGTCDAAANPTCPPNLEIPIAERFFAGGRTTHRAFTLDNLGIEGQTLKDGAGYGGNGVLVINGEWRIPVAGDLGVSLFFDVGNVFAGWRDIRVSLLRTGAGLGLHYLTPVGPVRLEYGYKLDRKPGESPGELSFSIGFPF